jgi:hypothetical protein
MYAATCAIPRLLVLNNTGGPEASAETVMKNSCAPVACSEPGILSFLKYTKTVSTDTPGGMLASVDRYIRPSAN